MNDERVKAPELRPNIKLDAFVIIPNHIHGIIVITETGMGRGVLNTPDDNTPDDERTISDYIINNPAKWNYDQFYIK